MKAEQNMNVHNDILSAHVNWEVGTKGMSEYCSVINGCHSNKKTEQ